MVSGVDRFANYPLPASKQAPAENQEYWYLLSITILLFGIHSTASIDIGQNITIPFALSFLVASFSYIFILKKLNATHSSPILVFLFLVFFVNIISYSSLYSSLYFLGPLQLLYSFIIAISAYILLFSIRLNLLQKWLFVMTTVITFLSVLELNPFVASSFNGITEFLTSNADLGTAFSASEARDLALHGAVRSKVFATEPSHTALTLTAIGFGFFWTRPRWQLVVGWMVLILICIWTIRSPILVVTLLLGPALSLMVRETKGRVAQLLIGGIFLFAFAFVVSDYVLVMFGSRIDTGGMSDGSFDMRFTVPLQFTNDFLPGHIVYGVGIVGDFDMLTYEILAAYHERGMRYIDYSNASNSLSNNLAQHFISFGLIFGVITLISLAFVARMRSGRIWLMVCVECLTIWMFLGGYVAARVWVLCALILAVARRAQLEQADNMNAARIERSHFNA